MGPGESKAVLFTDLDGTLLDHDTYQAGPASESLRRLIEGGVSVVLCSAKTRAEQVRLQADLGIETLSIIENGAAVVTAGETVASFGIPYEEVLHRLNEAAEEVGVTIRGFGDMTLEEIAETTGLTMEASDRARRREFSVTLEIVEGDGEAEVGLRDALRKRGLNLVRGTRFLSAIGDHDKGTAVRHLIDSWRSDSPDLVSYGVGDYHNDLEMLAEVDVPMLVQRPDGTWADLPLVHLVLIEGVGPVGWVAAADRVMADLSRPYPGA